MDRRRNRISLFATAVTAFFWAACAPAGDTGWEGNTEGRLQVVATFSIIEDLAGRVGGDRIALRTLVPRGSDPHTFEATPSDSRILFDAELILEIGRDFEPWMNRLHRSSRSRAKRVAVTEGLDLLPVDRHRAGHAGHGHGDSLERDPHVWHDVTRTMKIVEVLRDAFAELDPENAEVYAANADRYLDELAGLDAWIRTETARLAPTERQLFTNHDVFRYLAESYGFEIVGTALSSVTTEVFDPAASQIGRRIDDLRATGVRVVFPEIGGNTRLIAQIAREAGARVGPPLYADSLSPEDGEASTYIEMMRYNVSTLVGQLASEATETSTPGASR